MKIWEKEHAIAPLGSDILMEASSWAIAPLMQEVLSTGEGCVFEFKEGGTVNKEIIFYSEKLKSLGFKMVHNYLHSNHHSSSWANEDGMIDLVLNSASYLSISGYSKNEKISNEIVNFVRPTFLPHIKRGYIFAIVSSGGRLSMQSLGDASASLKEINYNSSVLADYKDAVKDLRAASPSGRIIILKGTPGTGKTHMIKSFLRDVPDAMFALISPDMVSSLDGPEFLPLLMQNKAAYCPAGPIILILEDADKCLVKRGDNNINSIQSLLNLSDGILGTLLDLRIIATTNAKQLEIEPAILRSGRLSKMIDVGPLDIATAKKVYLSLLPETKTFPKDLYNGKEGSVILADVYAVARKNGWVPEEREATSTNNYEGEDEDIDY